jgi:DNA-binding LytR/AlgR family response regulator
MKKYKCIIVDDEPIARMVIRSHCDKLNNLEVIAEYKSALEAMESIQNQEIDILFLDINMPKIDGITFMKNIDHGQIKVIYTTAYKEYAVDAFELKAHDYLVKPISFERFLKSISFLDTSEKIEPNLKEEYIFLKEAQLIHRILITEIIYLEAQQNYTKVVLAEQTIRTYNTLSSIEEKLTTDFIRVHRSYILNKNKIRTINANEVFVVDHSIPISNTYRKDFMKSIGLE